ncbi:MAG: 4-alpha-glucanotransferase [Acidimicrobiales bacterium]
MIVTHDPASVSLDGRWRLYLENGDELTIEGGLPDSTSWGYHRLEQLDGPGQADLIVSPGQCYWPRGLRQWGWAVQLYSLRSEGTWGIGDLVDLAQLCQWSAQIGAEVVMTNPLHAPRLAPRFEPSPYFPSSRCFQNPIYLRPEEILTAWSGGPREPHPDADAVLDYDAVWRAKSAALEEVWNTAEARAGLGHRLSVQPDPTLLEEFATFCAMAEVHPGPWGGWPSGLRRPGTASVAEFARARRDRVDFYSFLQVALDDQMARAASSGVGLAHDLAVGVAPDGFDAWMWQDCMVADASVGAPPDEFNPAGQDWGLSAFEPDALRQARYRPLVAALRAGFRHGVGLRIDHVMGLFRLFMVPKGSDPTSGSYIQANPAELLDVVALESWRARAWVVGEDLGTVGPGVRDELARRRLASYKVAWFEDAPPSAYPPLALACAGTHDLPTLAGLWSGSDLVDQAQAGITPNLDAAAEMKARLRRNFAIGEGMATEIDPQAPEGVAPPEVTGGPEGDRGTVDELGQRAVALALGLGRSPAGLALVTLEDALGLAHRHNMPGTVDSWPNWRMLLPEGLADMVADPRVAAVAQAMTRGRSNSPTWIG